MNCILLDVNSVIGISKWLSISYRVDSDVVYSTTIGNARASTRGIDNETIPRFFYVMPNHGYIIINHKRACIMKCAICDTEIRGHYLTDTWQQSICAEHKVEQCFSCGRFVKPSELHLPDSRCLCSFCQPSIVSLPQHVEWVEKRVRSILSIHGITDIPQNVPIRLVSPKKMATLNTTGKINLLQPGLALTSKIMGLFFSRYNHTIYIFSHLPKVQFAGILAHEMLHLWQNERNISLPLFYTEGFCNVGSYVVYKAINTDLSRHLIKKLKEDPNPIYGDGFRVVARIFKQNPNLCHVMDCIKNKS